MEENFISDLVIGLYVLFLAPIEITKEEIFIGLKDHPLIIKNSGDTNSENKLWILYLQKDKNKHQFTDLLSTEDLILLLPVIKNFFKIEKEFLKIEDDSLDSLNL